MLGTHLLDLVTPASVRKPPLPKFAFLLLANALLLLSYLLLTEKVKCEAAMQWVATDFFKCQNNSLQLSLSAA